jgi:hypothetical protein
MEKYRKTGTRVGGARSHMHEDSDDGESGANRETC